MRVQQGNNAVSVLYRANVYVAAVARLNEAVKKIA